MQQAEPARLHQGDRRGGDAAASGRPGARRRGRPGPDRRTRLEDQPYRALPLHPHRDRRAPLARSRARAGPRLPAPARLPRRLLRRAGPRGVDLVGRERLRTSALPPARRRLDPTPAPRRRRARPPGARDLADRAPASTWSARRRRGRRTPSATRCPTPPTSAAVRCRRPSTRPGCPSITDALVLKALHEDDLDLLGELLMAPALLRRDWTPVQWFGWRVLCDTWAHYGFVPGPGLPPPVEGEDAAETVRRVLGTVYHTTLVGGLAVATLVSTGSLPAADASGRDRRATASDVDPADDLPRLAAHLAHALPRRAGGARRRTRRDRPAPRRRRHRRRRDRGVA